MTLTAEQQATLDQLTAKIVAANPEIRKGSGIPTFCMRCERMKRTCDECMKPTLRPITLENVLQAANGIWMGVSHTGYVGRMSFSSLLPDGEYWQLGLPLHLQKPEVHEFLNNLLP